MAHRSRLDADARSIALWSWLVGVLMVSATLPPLLRWIDAAVDDLLAVPQPTPAALMGVGARLWTSTGPAELAGALAGSVARLMTVPYVAIELDRTDDRLAATVPPPPRGGGQPTEARLTGRAKCRLCWKPEAHRGMSVPTAPRRNTR